MNKPLLKVCGMTQPVNIREADSLGLDFMGFIFYPKSPRYVGKKGAGISAIISKLVSTSVGVFVDEPADTILASVDKYNLKAIQLHGDESAALCKAMKDTGLTVFKSYAVNGVISPKEINSYAGSVDYMLFDTKTTKKGGSGRSFDWTKLNDLTIEIPFFVAGGIRPEDAEKLKTIENPKFAGVDINSRFETMPGIKDINRIIQFKQALESGVNQ